MKGLAKSRNVTPDLYACNTDTRQTTPKWRFSGKITHLREHFQNSSIKVQYCTPIDVFFPNCMPICAVTKKNNFIVPVIKHPLFAAILRPFGPWRQILPREIWFRPTYVGKILSGSVMVCRSYSRKADLKQIHITLSCICMTAYNYHQLNNNEVLQDYTIDCKRSHLPHVAYYDQIPLRHPAR